MKRAAVVLLTLAFLGGSIAAALPGAFVGEPCPMSGVPRSGTGMLMPCPQSGNAAGAPCEQPSGAMHDCMLIMDCSTGLTTVLSDRFASPTARETVPPVYVETGLRLVGRAIPPPLSPPIAAS